MNLAQCVHLQRRHLHGTWIRTLHPKHAAHPLATAHTRTHPTRFNPGTPADPGFEILYLAEDVTVALFEVQALLGSVYPGANHVPNPAGGAWVTINVQVDLQAVVDFTRLTSRGLIETSVQELTGDWLAYALRSAGRVRGGVNGSDVPTQKLGRRLARFRHLEGFVSYSAKVATRRNLMIFPGNLQPGSQLSWQDPATGKWTKLP